MTEVVDRLLNRFFKGVLQFFLVVSIASIIAWKQLSEEQRKWLMVVAGIEPSPVISSEKHRPPPVTEIPAKDQQADVRNNEKPAVQVNHEFGLIQSYNCFRPETGQITEAPVSQVFSWVDATGKRHFSDTPPEGQISQDLSEKYRTEKEYFQLEISSPDGGLPTLMEEQLNRDVVAIYRYLTDDLGLDHLRKVTLNLKVFGGQAAFIRYQQQHAPNLKGVSGFYSALSNEAVVLRQSDPEWTRRVARHEATHVIMAGLYGQTPLWLNEGLAEAFGDYRNVALSRRFDIPQGRLHQLRSIRQTGQLPSLGSFFNLHALQWQQSDPAIMYSTSWALVKFMLEVKQARPVLLAVLQQLAEQPCSPVNMKRMVAATYPDGLPAFEEHWLSWLDRKLF